MALFSRRLKKRQVVEFLRYLLASGIALGVDYGIYRLAAQQGHIDLPQAAVVGYLSGLIVAYFLIGERVFTEGWLKHRKIFEALLFVSSGILGLIMTYLVVTAFVFLFGPMLNEAKLVAVIFSFLGVYLFRKFVVFKKARVSA
ncbi:MAG: GtrA family protein [Alcaligenaceae bacterium]